MTKMLIQCTCVFFLSFFGIVLTQNNNIFVQEPGKDKYASIIDELRQKIKEHNTMYAKQIDELRRQVTSNEHRIHLLEGENKNMKAVNEKCLNVMSQLKTQVKVFDGKIEYMEGEHAKMKVVNGECVNDMTLLKTQVHDYAIKKNDMVSDIKTETQPNSNSESKEGNSVTKVVKRSMSEFLDKKAAFSASISGPHITELGKYQPVVFDHVFTNIGNSYSPFTGVFTSPINGTYYFTATVMSDYGDYVETEISFYGKSMVFMMSGDSKYEQGQNSIVLEMNTGDQVWVRLQSHQGTAVHGYHWSTFSGFQIDY